MSSVRGAGGRGGGALNGRCGGALNGRCGDAACGESFGVRRAACGEEFGVGIGLERREGSAFRTPSLAADHPLRRFLPMRRAAF